MSLYGLGLRASFKISDTIRDRGLQAPKDIVRFDNLLYGTDPALATLDVYRPRNAGGTALPVNCQRSRRRLGLWRIKTFINITE